VRRLVVHGIPRSGKNSGQNGVTFDGRPIRRKSAAAAVWLSSAVRQLLDQLRTAPLIRGRCRVTVHVFHALPLTSWDSDNVVNLALDAAKKALLVADDCAAIVRETETATDVDKSRPRVEITVGPCVRLYDSEGNTL
jgi:Holliday junction resolvase RusA-like endonuclease